MRYKYRRTCLPSKARCELRLGQTPLLLIEVAKMIDLRRESEIVLHEFGFRQSAFFKFA